GLHNIGQAYYHVQREENCDNDIQVTSTGIADADIDAGEVFDNPPDQTVTAVVAIVDTGIDMDHPELAGRIWINPGEIADNDIDDDHNGFVDDVHGWDFCNKIDLANLGEDNDPSDEHGHGTHCAGIIAAVAGNGEGVAGIADNCLIMPLKFSPVMLSSLAARAIVYAADNGADVISMSWGYPWQVRVLDDALAYARAKGVILVAAAGNDGAAQENYPAAFPGVIAVGATTSSDQVTDFSTFGEHLKISAPGLSILSLRADTTDMYAPCEAGVHIVSNSYYLASGTSMACPFVAGVAAYLREVSPGLTSDHALSIIEATADDIIDPYGTGGNYPGWDQYSGYGRVNLSGALAATPSVRAKIEMPKPNQIVSGNIFVSGIADGDDFAEYVLEYGAGSQPVAWYPILTSMLAVTDGIIGEWNTESLNGQYTIRLRVGETNISSATVHVINSSDVSIASPLADDTVVSWTSIVGTAIDPDFSHYVLEYGAGFAPDAWEQLDRSSIPVVSGELAVWNTSALTDSVYTLRLSVFTGAGLAGGDSVSVYVQSPFSGDHGWRVHLDNTIALVPNYGDFNNDGENEIVVGTSDSLHFFKPDGTPLTSGVPAAPGNDYRIPVVVGNLDGDGIDDLVAVGAWGTAPHATLFGFPSGASAFSVHLPMGPIFDHIDGGNEKYYPSLFLKDIDNDGKDEIHYYTGWRANTQAHRFIYNPDGTFRCQLIEPSLSFAVSLPADLNGDSIDEVYSTGNNRLYLCDQTGLISMSYEWPQIDGGFFEAENISAVDMDGDGKLELVVSGHYDNDLGHFWIFTFDENLTLKPGWPHDTGIDNFVVVSSPIFGDIDTDGSMEYMLTMWELSYGQVFSWHIDGSAFAGDSNSAIFTVTPNPGKIHSPLLADLNDDGLPDLLACAGPDVFLTYNVERIVAWDERGEVLSGWPLVTVPDAQYPGNFGWHTPAVGDVDGDGFVDLMMTTVMNDLVFINLEGMHFRSHATPVPFWKYNRRLNSIGPQRNNGTVCGDGNGDGYLNLLDILLLIDYLYEVPPGPAPDPLEAGDANGDGDINLLDILRIITYLYGSPPGPEPICP
ncbi:MAG: S8 family serine peptidase, partial [Candidatus Zixiibacteriota bacterium]